jgi:hypothetical protein
MHISLKSNKEPIMLLYFENTADSAALAGFQTVSQFLLKWWKIVKIYIKKYDSAVFVYSLMYFQSCIQKQRYPFIFWRISTICTLF